MAIVKAKSKWKIKTIESFGRYWPGVVKQCRHLAAFVRTNETTHRKTKYWVRGRIMVH